MSIGIVCSNYELELYKKINPLQEDIHNIQKKPIPSYRRAKNFVLIPYAFLTTIADIVIGIFASIAVFLTLGRNPKYYVFASKQLNSSRLLVSMPFMHLLSTINPNLKCIPSDACYISKMWDKNYDQNVDVDGITAKWINKLIEPIAVECRKPEKKWYTRYITTRLTYTALAIAMVIARVIDLIIGTIAAIIALATLGQYRKINQAAYNGLLFTSIIHDLFHCFIKIINPWAGIDDTATNHSRLNSKKL